MQDLDPLVLLAVFLEMMGPLLWILLAIALAAVVGFVVVLRRERTLITRRLVISEVIGLFGGVAALVIMAWVTVSGFSDAGGPVDWLLIGIIFGAGVVGTTILAYTILGLLQPERRRQSQAQVL